MATVILNQYRRVKEQADMCYAPCWLECSRAEELIRRSRRQDIKSSWAQGLWKFGAVFLVNGRKVIYTTAQPVLQRFRKINICQISR